MKFTGILTVVILMNPLMALSAAEAFIVDRGEPRAEILIGDKPARMTKLAAKELQNTLSR